MGTEIKEEESGQISELEQKVIRQIEHYFGNFNLSKDKFLRDQLKFDEGWVPLETMIKFKRLKSITDDFDVICTALKKSPNELMEVDEESKKIRRRKEKPLPVDDSSNRDALDERTLYVKGFKKTNTLDELLEFFNSHKVENVAMRRNKMHKNKPFKGSCFVLFETKEDAEKFLASEIKYENTELLKERRKDYTKRKDIYYQNIRAEREKKASNKKASNEEKDGENKDDESKDKEDKEIDMTPGCLIKICGLGKDCSREDIKPVFEKYGTVVFVDYSRGNPEAVVRFESAVAANVLEEATDGENGEKKIEIASSMATISAVEGDSEKEYWKNIAISKANARKFSHNQRSNRGRFNKNNKNWGRKRNQRDGDDEGRPSKMQKTDAVDNGQKDLANEKPNGAKEDVAMKEEA